MDRPVVESIDRPDVNGNTAKMQPVADQAKKTFAGVTGFLVVKCDDNIMSSVTIRAAVEPQDQWVNGIFYNARYAVVSITPMKGKRYYDPADPKVTISCDSGKLRKYTGPIDKALGKIKAFLQTLST